MASIGVTLPNHKIQK